MCRWYCRYKQDEWDSAIARAQQITVLGYDKTIGRPLLFPMEEHQPEFFLEVQEEDKTWRKVTLFKNIKNPTHKVLHFGGDEFEGIDAPYKIDGDNTLKDNDGDAINTRNWKPTPESCSDTDAGRDKWAEESEAPEVEPTVTVKKKRTRAKTKKRPQPKRSRSQTTLARSVSARPAAPIPGSITRELTVLRKIFSRECLNIRQTVQDECGRLCEVLHDQTRVLQELHAAVEGLGETFLSAAGATSQKF